MTAVFKKKKKKYFCKLVYQQIVVVVLTSEEINVNYSFPASGTITPFLCKQGRQKTDIQEVFLKKIV